MVCTPTSCSELQATDEMPVQDAVSRTVQVLQVRFELHGHVQLHLLRIVFTRTMPSYMESLPMSFPMYPKELLSGSIILSCFQIRDRYIVHRTD